MNILGLSLILHETKSVLEDNTNQEPQVGRWMGFCCVVFTPLGVEIVNGYWKSV